MVRQRYKDYEINSVFKCPQEDNIQREGVISFDQEAQLIKRASTNMANYVFPENDLEPDYNQKETLDIIGEKKEIDKIIKNNKKEYEKEKEIIKNKIKEYQQGELAQHLQEPPKEPIIPVQQ
nr:MAG TPA: hypothetical protein [Microviridae sp.]